MIPALSIVAMVVSPDDQLPPETLSATMIELPMQTWFGPDTGGGGATIEIPATAVQPLGMVYINVSAPAVIPRNSPLGNTSAMVLSVRDQLPPELLSENQDV